MTRCDGTAATTSSHSSCSWSWAAAGGVFIVQVTLPSVITTYGVLLLHLLHDGQISKWHGTATPLVFMASRSFTEIWCGEMNLQRTVAVFGILIAVLGASIASVPWGNIFGVGILAGAGTALASAQCASTLRAHFPQEGRLSGALTTAGEALGQFTAPLLLHALLLHWGTMGAQVILAAVTLHSLVGVVLLRAPKYTRLQNQSVCSDVELSSISTWDSARRYSTDGGSTPLLSSPTLHVRNWKNPATQTDSHQFSALFVGPERSPASMRRKVMMSLGGVEIMPDIPEESGEEEEEEEDEDEEDEDEENDVVDAKDEAGCATPQCRVSPARTRGRSRTKCRPSCPCVPPRPPTDLPLKLQRLRQRLCGCNCYRLGWRLRRLLSALRRRRVYACWLLDWARLVPPLFLVLTPALALEAVPDYSAQEAAFAVSVPAFARLCLLVTAPCCTNFSPNTLAYLSGVGGILAAAGLYVMSCTNTHDSLLLGAALMGAGHGGQIATGARFLSTGDSLRVQASADLISGCFSLLLVYLLGMLVMQPAGVSLCFTVMACMQLTSSLVWLLRPLASSSLQCCKSNISREWPNCSDIAAVG